MALNIKNLEVERLAAEVARLTKESKTEAIRRSIEERKARLELRLGTAGRRGLREFLETRVWPQVPPDVLGKPLSKEEEEQILGYGPEGY